MNTTMHDNLTDKEIINNPHPYFRLLREKDPVHWNEMWGGWILTRYDDVANAFQDPRLSAERMRPSKKMNEQKANEMHSTFQLLSKWMVFNDPPKHTRLRLLANKSFTPKAVSKMTPRIKEIANELLDHLKESTHMDVIRDFAYALPILVISEMLGVPKEDRDILKKWSDELLYFVFGAVGIPDRHERAKRSLDEMADYLGKIAENRRKNPKEDLISLIAMAAEGDDQLTTEEIVATCTLLVFGGHETTTNLIANGVFSLLNNPGQFDLLKKKPSLMPSAVEEFLRYEGPSKAMMRIAKEEMELRGKEIKAGDKLLLVQAAANRDPEKFTNPDQLEIDRKINQHLGFGRGIHYCLGAPLAREEAAIAIGELIFRFPNMKLKQMEYEWMPTLINRQLKSLPVFLT